MSLNRNTPGRQEIDRELSEKSARDATWLALYLVQRNGWIEQANQLTSIVASIDDLRQGHA